MEQDLERQGYDFVIGVDEAGRGALAGPVVAAACFLPPHVRIEGIQDSKTLSEKRREKVYESLVSHEDVIYDVCFVGEGEIDDTDILKATLAAMSRSIHGVWAKAACSTRHHRSKPMAIIDGLHIPPDMSIEAVGVVKADSSIRSVSAASIIAKVSRDRHMRSLDTKYPQYGFVRNKGYPTAEHRRLIQRFGRSEVHRQTFKVNP